MDNHSSSTVSYGLSHRIVTFRTAHGAKLTHAPGSKVACEVDAYVASTGVGWSVLVQGVAIDATTALDDVSWTARGARPHPVAPPKESIAWPSGPPDHWSPIQARPLSRANSEPWITRGSSPTSGFSDKRATPPSGSGRLFVVWLSSGPNRVRPTWGNVRILHRRSQTARCVVAAGRAHEAREGPG